MMDTSSFGGRLMRLGLLVLLGGHGIVTAHDDHDDNPSCNAELDEEACRAYASDSATDNTFYFCTDAYVWEWSNDAITMPTAASDSSCLTMDKNVIEGLEEDVMLVLGGCDAEFQEDNCSSVTEAAMEYSPSNDAFTLLDDMPRQRYRFAAVNVSNYVYLLGGRNESDGLVKQIDFFDVLTSSWDTLDDEWEGATSDNAGFSTQDGSIYVVGGYDASYADFANTYKVTVDPDAKSASFEEVASMEASRGDHSCIKTPGDDYAYCMGGFTNGPNAVDSLERYDTSTDTWTTLEHMQQARGDFAVGYLNSRIHVVGGEDAEGSIANVEWYDVENDCWTGSDLFDIPFDRFRYCGATNTADDRIYAFGGQSSARAFTSDGGNVSQVTDISDGVLWYQEIATSSTGTAGNAAPAALSLGSCAAPLLLSAVVAAVMLAA